jgi:hypothetical protein
MSGWDTPPDGFDTPPTDDELGKKWGGSIDLPALGEGIQRGATLDFSDEISGGIQAFAKFPGDPESFFDRYAKWRDAKRATQDAAQQRAPGSTLLGGLLGGAMTAPLQAAPGAVAARVGSAVAVAAPAAVATPTALQLIGQGAKAGAVYGGASGLGGSKKDTVRGTLGDVTLGTLLGTALGAGGAGLGVLARPGKVISPAEVSDLAAPAIAQAEGRAPIIQVNRLPGAERESAAVIDAIKQAAKATKVEAAPAGASEFQWTTGPTTSTGEMGVRPMPAGPTTTTIQTGPPIEIPGKAAMVLPKPGSMSKDAAFLESKGAKLTIGQKNTGHEVAQIEEASTSLPGQGQAILNQRQKAEESIRAAVMNAARAPGAPPVRPSGDQWNDLALLGDGFNRSYDAFRGIPVYPAVHGPGGGPLQGVGSSPGLIEQALNATEGITDEARAVVARKVLNELTRLPERKGAVGQIDLGDLLKVRSTVRTAKRDLLRSSDTASADRRAAYDTVEEVLTAAIDSQTPGETGQALKAVDAAYRKYKMVEHAMEMAGTRPGGFTPYELSAGIRLATSKPGWSRGHAGEMWEIAKAWRNVTQQITPPTGARAVVLDMMPGGARYAKLRAQAIISANENVLRLPAGE